jgi:hypothetical protein
MRIGRRSSHGRIAAGVVVSTVFVAAAAVLVAVAFAEVPHDEALRNADGSWKYTNALAGETNPYLLLHAHNPVDWYPWGPEALERAR